VNDQAEHFAIAIAITGPVVLVAPSYGAVIWRAWFWNIWYVQVFRLATCLWAGSLGEIWAHAWRVLRQPTGGRWRNLSAGTIPATYGPAEGGDV
jgi:hypothetical protein